MERYRELLDTLRDRVLESPGELDREVRLAAAERGDLPEKLRGLVGKLHDEAYKISDRDLSSLIEAGYSEDQLFELIVSAALGAGIYRLEIVKRAMKEAG